MFELKQTKTFRKWRAKLKDERARAIIASRLDRLAFGHAGDAVPVGEGTRRRAGRQRMAASAATAKAARSRSQPKWRAPQASWTAEQMSKEWKQNDGVQIIS